jgi:hypothetical protein
MLAISSLAFGQFERMIQNFDHPRPDTAFWQSKENGNALTIAIDTVDKVEGNGSLKASARMAALHQWGTYCQFGVTLDTATAPWDFSVSDSISIWMKIPQAAKTQWMVLRIQFADRPTKSDPKEQWIYENASILKTATSGWINLRVPLLERKTTGTEAPDSTGFITPPTNWGGLTWNNSKFDRDKIIEWSIALVTSGWDASANLPPDSVIVLFDKFERFGARATPVIIFNGMAFDANVVSGSAWTWGQSSVTVEKGVNPTNPKGYGVKWVMGDEWANGWSGWGLNLNPQNMVGAWMKDSLKFKMKTDTIIGDLRAQFESGNGKRGKIFKPFQDTLWHTYVIALKDMTFDDGKPNFDSSAVTIFGLMANGTAKAGRVVRVTDIWTGSPVFDVIPPDKPTGLGAAGSSFTNLITWNEVTSEPNVKYNVYFGTKAWTDYNDTTVEDLPPYNLTSAMANHSLRSPLTDQNVTYFYGVVAKDPAGNESNPTVMTTGVTTLAKGVPCVSMTAPVNFVADGAFTDWSKINFFDLSVTKGTAHAVPNYPIGSDADLSLKAWVAIDAQNLYVAFDVTDDMVVVDTTAADYEQDCPDLFIGLYDWKGKRHGGYGRGATPDYHLRFSKNRIQLDNGGKTIMYAYTGNPNYIWKQKTLTSGYVAEAKIPLATLAGLLTGNDKVFVPKDGMRIPIDFAINDRDSKTTRDGIMCYSNLTNDNSWQDMFYWTYTWIKTTTDVEQISNITPMEYALSSNYPNPFNPSTQIRYSIAKAGNVSLKVFDVTGREVASLVNQRQDAGTYSVTFNAASKLSSGVYFFHLQSGAFTATNKMILMK